MTDRYYADLNPRFGARYERRYAVFIRRSASGPSNLTNLHYTTRKGAEVAARKLNGQERDEYAHDDTPSLDTSFHDHEMDVD